ncbi:MAG TPA: hypothetical protein VM422_02510 [Amaricoccus sp.]|nr:hypothetical protein [Amaricoccus sp.]
MTADAVRGELARILASPHFDASERNRSFFAFVVEEALIPLRLAGLAKAGLAMPAAAPDRAAV